MKVALCDDDKIFRDKIKNHLNTYIEEYPEIEMFEFCCGEDLLNSYNAEHKYDILLLDVELININGLDTAEEIRKLDKNVIIIFISSYTQYVFNVFSLNAFNYLVKPFTLEEFNEVLNKAIKQHRVNYFKYSVKNNESIINLEIKDILYIEGYRRHIKVFTEDNIYESVGKLKDQEKILKSYNFVTCHQGFLVNMAYIKEISKSDIILTNGSEVPISVRKRADTIKEFNRYLEGHSI
ncbi:sensory transduction protein LytT [Gottschalkia acidurici 9a]|uniref:Sensory transduction protein LytT n=1 Tax=Gottschalkia acidurici (strain ATCC 7906 / DSM 604 / BCRC 14475 / CIP 104303 / KCTC 5404 / NCIMB 10678 / 9a) TaxID=1128398 RepID=K0B211_GOTA9|nr:LytTR family DNA-binding domain-containing protein [Gottschalkia acidurici]AFS78960.1 sensory transduction protein LytT [Gottschalkia acidurici 9a]